jgi:hypothetical protein
LSFLIPIKITAPIILCPRNSATKLIDKENYFKDDNIRLECPKVVLKNLVYTMTINCFIIYSVLFVLTSLFFLGSFNIIQSVEGQMNIDSFSAKGIIFSKLLHSPLLDNQESNDSRQSMNSSLNNSLNSVQKNNTKDIPIVEGGWELTVQRGEVGLFRAIFTLSKDGKILNAFALQNLKNNKFVQINDQGTEIIAGTVDFTSVGLKNATLSDVDTTVTITGLTQFRISLDKNMTGQYLTDPIMGVTKIFVDASGNILVGPRPPPSPSPQPNSFSSSNLRS